MKFRLLTDIELTQFFELSALHGTLFVQKNWVQLYGEKARCYGLFRDDDTMIGGLSLYATKLKGVNSLITSPFAQHNGLFWVDQGITNPARKSSFLKEVSGIVADGLQSSGYSFLKFELPPEVLDVQPFIWNKFEVQPRYTYRLDLSQGIEKIRAGLDPGTRSMLNKAEREGLQARRTSDPDLVAHFVINTLTSKKVKAPVKLARSIIQSYVPTTEAIAVAVTINEKDVSCSFCVCDSQSAYYLLGGFDRSSANNATTTFGLWNCIVAAHEKGLKYFDFEGSMIQDIEKFFRGFGAELVPYHAVVGGNKLAVQIYRMIKK